MIIIDLNELELYKIIPSSFIEKSLEKHCNKTKCEDCKYLMSYKTCKTAYALEHNLMRIGRKKYFAISDEERRFIYNIEEYCHGKACSKCRYTNLVYDKGGNTLNCSISRIVAHRIIKGEITRDQYEIRKQPGDKRI